MMKMEKYIIHTHIACGGKPHEVIAADANKYVPAYGTEIGVIHSHPHGRELSDLDKKYAENNDKITYMVRETRNGAQLVSWRKFYIDGKVVYDQDVIANNLPYYELSNDRKGELKGKFYHLWTGHKRGCDKCRLRVIPMDSYK